MSEGNRGAVSLMTKSQRGIRETRGGWRRKGQKVHNLSRDTCSWRAGPTAIVGIKPARAGVRAFIVAMKPVNAGGAKGRRKVNAE